MEPLVADLVAETEETAKPIDWVAHMAVIYYGYEQFAEEVLGISLTEWVGALPGEKEVVEPAAEVLAFYERQLDVGTGEGDSEDVVAVAADAEDLCETLQEEWQRVDEPIFMRTMDRRDPGDPR
jgi:hypothetical protein